MILCYIYIKEAKLMNKNQYATSLIINLLDKKCFIHQLLKRNIINIQTTKNIDKTKLKHTCKRDQIAFWRRHALNYYWRQQIKFVIIQIVVQNYHLNFFILVIVLLKYFFFNWRRKQELFILSIETSRWWTINRSHDSIT